MTTAAGMQVMSSDHHLHHMLGVGSPFNPAFSFASASKAMDAALPAWPQQLNSTNSRTTCASASSSPSSNLTHQTCSNYADLYDAGAMALAPQPELPFLASSSHFQPQPRPCSAFTGFQYSAESEVDAFLKDAQSSDMEQFLLELLQQSSGSNVAGGNGNNAGAGAGAGQRGGANLRQSSYQSLMEMALMDGSEGQAFGEGMVKPSFVASSSTSSASFSDVSRASTPLYSMAEGVVVQAPQQAPQQAQGQGQQQQRTFLEAMSSRQAEEWMSQSQVSKAQEVEELEREFMRIYGSNVNANLKREREVDAMASLLEGQEVSVSGSASACFASSLDQLDHPESMMMDLDSFPDSNFAPVSASVSASASTSVSGLDFCHALLPSNPTPDPMQPLCGGGGLYSGTGMQAQQHKVVDSCHSSSWPGGGGGGGGGGVYKHYGQPLAQLKNNKMSVNFMAAQPSSNSSTLALVQAFAPAASVPSSHYHARTFATSQSVGNVNVEQLQLSRNNSMPSSHKSAVAGAHGGAFLGHSMSFPADHKMQQQQGFGTDLQQQQGKGSDVQYRVYRGATAPSGATTSSVNNFSPATVMATGLQLVHLLLACAEAVAEENMELAHVILERLSTLVVPLGNPMQRLAAYFAEALAARISNNTRSHLFKGLQGISHKSVPKTEILEALSVCYDCLPIGKFGHLTANQVLLDAIETEHNVHVIDLHIWYGMQWPAFFQALASRDGGPPNVRISAVGSSYEELKETGDTLHQCAKQLKVPLEYCPIVVPLEEFNIRLLELRRGEACVVNSFTALHTLLHKGNDNFNRILRGLRSLNPKVLALAENDGNHNSPAFLNRFVECLRYYSAVFDAFDASLPPDSPARMKMEQLLAAQKIRNIIACEGTERVERHESMAEWGKRMEAAGFCPLHLSTRAVSQAELLLNLYYSNGYTLAHNSGYLALGWHTMPLMGVSAWR